jgi:hypothetical protein
MTKGHILVGQLRDCLETKVPTLTHNLAPHHDPENQSHTPKKNHHTSQMNYVVIATINFDGFYTLTLIAILGQP